MEDKTMSAIAGIYRYHEPIDTDHSRIIIEALRQYQADRTTTWYENNVILGCHIQNITEHSQYESLPFHDPDRNLSITADVILDNRDELIRALQGTYNLSNAVTDSELLLLAYEKWADRMPEYLVGDFAFMIWDSTNKTLFGARDFSGTRTLYYHSNEEQFCFSSMISPILSLPYIHKQLNEQWLAEFLAISGIFEPPDLSSTVFKNIYQLPPSHTILVKQNKIILSRYNSLGNISPLRLTSSSEYDEVFREVFHQAVTSRMSRTKKNIAAHLSGGLDSGSVASFAAKALSKENRVLHTYSYIPEEGFEDWTPKHRVADESPLIMETVRYVGNINDHYIRCEGRSPYSEIDEWLEILETPYKFFENSFWLRGIYEEAHRQDVGFLLSGARGNYSISWGSALDFYTKLFKNLHWLRLSREVNLYSKNVGAGRKRIYSMVGRKAFPFIGRNHYATSTYEYPQLINTDFAKQVQIYDKVLDPKFTGIGSTADLPTDPLEARKQHFERFNMWGTTGTSSSKLSLRYSVWGHDPTNDLRVIRLCLSIPFEQYVQNGMDRALIRRSTKGWLPDSIRLNQRTRGIQGADSLYRMTHDWSKFIDELEHMVRDSRMEQIINMDLIRESLSEARHGLNPNQAYSPSIKILMRSLIVYRFLQKHF